MLNFDDLDDSDDPIVIPEKSKAKRKAEPLTHETSEKQKREYQEALLTKENPSPIERRQRELKLLAQHKSGSVEHYLPEPYVEASRLTMGGIDLDPATCQLANEAVKATNMFGHWYDPTGQLQFVDGLLQQWHGKVLLNPPGGKTSKHNPSLTGISKSYAVVWWGKLVSEWLAGNVEQAIFVGFTLEILRTTQKLSNLPLPLNFPMCFPSKRICFDYPLDTEMGRPVMGTERRESAQPTHPNVIVYLPPKTDNNTWLRLGNYAMHFAETFETFGEVVLP